MVQVSDFALGKVQTFAPLPPFTTPEEIMADALPLLDPPSRMTVTSAAEQYLRVPVQGAWQRFDREVTPYMVEPSDATQSRLFKAVGFVGPSQSGKTMMLQAVTMHAVTCDQDTVMIFHMSRSDRDKWVEEKLNPLIENSPEILTRLGHAREDSTFSRKRFKGMRVLVEYPTPTALSGGSYKMVLLTDVDHMPLTVGGKDNPEGSPYAMARNRTKTYLSRGCVLAESSPAWPVLDPSWKASQDTPHMLPPVAGGIVHIYNQGTRARLYWECPDCQGEYEPRIDRLHYDAALDPAQAGASAEMQCPHCGGLLSHRHKMEMNRKIFKGKGGWRHEGEDGKLVAMGDAGMRPTDIASYALNGAAATFSNWPDIVSHLEAARQKAAQLGDETDLATVYYTEIGVPFRSTKSEQESDVDLQFLKDHAHTTPKGVAPDWTRFITISFDVQGTYFAMQAMAWGDDGQSQVIDRIDMTQPPATSPNAEKDAEGHSRTLAPEKYLEDWDLLPPFADRVWPVEGQTYGLRAVALVVDFQGKPGVSDNAEAFWRQRNRDGHGKRWFVSRGHGGWKQSSRFWHASPERRSGGGKARNIKLLNIATDRVKDTIAAALSKVEGGKGALFTPQWMEDAALEEFIAEERTSKGWAKKKGMVRNEGFDLSVMARALAELLGVLRIDQDAPPAWALTGPDNSFAVALDGGEAPGLAAPKTPRPPRPKGPVVHAIKYLKR
ncbi:MAG TPA: terminase [Aliiroseovarius sp.]|nr:terminase [Aliiroseovarius sp.]